MRTKGPGSPLKTQKMILFSILTQSMKMWKTKRRTSQLTDRESPSNAQVLRCSRERVDLAEWVKSRLKNTRKRRSKLPKSRSPFLPKSPKFPSHRKNVAILINATKRDLNVRCVSSRRRIWMPRDLSIKIAISNPFTTESTGKTPYSTSTSCLTRSVPARSSTRTWSQVSTSSPWVCTLLMINRKWMLISLSLSHLPRIEEMKDVSSFTFPRPLKRNKLRLRWRDLSPIKPPRRPTIALWFFKTFTSKTREIFAKRSVVTRKFTAAKIKAHNKNRSE